MNLRIDFNEAAKKLQEQTASISKKIVPEWQPWKWTSPKDNCYNFALNRNDEEFLTPGELSGSPFPDRNKDFNKYMETLYKGSIADGLRFLGGEPIRFSDGETPVALFYMHESDDLDRFNPTHDFHWYVPRNSDGDLVWAQKVGKQNAQTIMGVDIFTAARLMRYNYFGGFFAVPDSLAL